MQQVFNRKKRMRTSRPITFQRDAAIIYRRRRAPRRIRRLLRKRAYAVRSVINKSLASQQFIIHHSGLFSNGADGQGFVDFAMMGRRGFTARGFNDMQQLIAAQGWNEKIKIFSKTLRMDLTLVNATADGTMELDVYHYIITRDIQYANLIPYYNAMNSANDTLTGTTAIDKNTVGWTPFDCPLAANNCRIYKTRRYYISAGQAISFVIRQKRDRVIKVDDFSLVTTGGQTITRGTKGVFCIFKGLPDATNAIASVTSLRYSQQNTLRYAIDDDSIPRAGKLPL